MVGWVEVASHSAAGQNHVPPVAMEILAEAEEILEEPREISAEVGEILAGSGETLDGAEEILNEPRQTQLRSLPLA